MAQIIHSMKQITFLLFVLCSHLATAQNNLRVEPMNWWVGMKNPKVQLLLQGDNLRGATVTSSQAGIQIQQVHNADSPNYLFVDLLIKANAKPGNYTLRVQKGGKLLHKIEYPLLARKSNSALRPGFNSSDVIYLVTPDRFSNGDSSNDVVKGMKETSLNRAAMYDRHGGDLQGLINHLDYMKDMGFTAIWNMPVQVNDQAKESYHGYSITDYYQVDPRFGTNALFKEFSEKAQAKGIKTIMDVVINHCGDGHWWMKDLPFKNWLNMDGKFVSTSHRRETAQDPHASAFDKKLETDGWFVPTMPDLNTRNPFLGTYLIQNAIWWVEYASLGGLRIDTWPYSWKEYSAAWAKALMTEYPNFNLVGEEWSSNPIIPAYYQKGQKNRDGFVGELPSLMDFPLQSAVSEAMRGNDKDWGQGLNKVYEVLANDLVYANPGNLVIFGDNHDMSRFYTQVKHDVDLLKMGMTILLTTRGIPQIFYGTEVLMANPNSSEHGEIRGDMYGGWAGDTKSAFTAQGLSPAEKDAQAFFKKILNWRKSNEVIHTGKLLHFGPADGVYVYFRYSAKGKVMVIVNKNTSSVDLALDRFAEILPAGAKVRDVLSSTPSAFVLGKTLQVPAKKAWVLEVE